MYGGTGSSLYGGSYGGGSYGSSMYGGAQGGYGGSSMYGRQNMQGEGQWFAPKVQQGVEEPQMVPQPLMELRELNTSFLDSVHNCGDNVCNFARRLMEGLARLHVAVLAGSLDKSTARQLALLAIATFAACVATALRGRRRTTPWPPRPPFAMHGMGRASAL